MKIVAVIIIVLVLAALALGWYRTYKTQHSPNEKLFLSGTVPSPLPDGFYSGSLAGYRGAWLGKAFVASTQSGINMFATGDNGTPTQKYPFKTYTGKGLRDTSTDVLKIDYAKADNPFWVKFVLDEIVQTEPGNYLGKIYIRLLGTSFAIGYFHLTGPQ